MATTIDQAFVKQFEREVHEAYQRQGSNLRKELGAQNISCAVVEQSSKQDKNTRILESFDAVMAARALYVHEEIKQTPFLTEMMEWQPMTKSNFDDGLDAVAGALSLAPVRLKRLYAKGSNVMPWQGGGMHKANSEFDV